MKKRVIEKLTRRRGGKQNKKAKKTRKKKKLKNKQGKEKEKNKIIYIYIYICLVDILIFLLQNIEHFWWSVFGS